ncbi:sigma-70 family RNA polymerase sigma factor [Anaerolineales bacterium]
MGDMVTTEPDQTILEWVERAKQKDQDAYAELVYSFQDAVYNLCYRMLGESGEAEDATQEAFLRAFTHLTRYDVSRSFKTWLLSIASNHCIDRLRKRRLQFLSLDDEPTAAVLALSSDDPLPEIALQRQERSEYIQALLADLAPEYRAAVVLRYWYDYSYIEIAETLETTESAIKSRLFRARQMLADKLDASSGNRHDSLLEGI